MRLARPAATAIVLTALGLALAGTAVAAPTPAPQGAQGDQGAQSAGESKPGAMVDVRVGTPLKTPSVVASKAVSAKAASSTFQVTYTGFTPAAQAAFQRAVDIWASQLTSTVPITVSASFEPLGTNVLGQAGPSSVWRDFSGAPTAGTWYVDAVANKRSGSQRSSSPDIVARFSSNFSNWYYGTGAAPAGTYDFTSVVLHELGHGVGFLGGGAVSGGQGTLLQSGYPQAYSRFTETGAGTALLSLPNSSTQLGSALQSNSVFFDATKVRSANGGNPAKLYAPSTWQPGSSYSHLDEATFPAGNANSLMTPQIGSGETIRDPGPISRALLLTTGW